MTPELKKKITEKTDHALEHLKKELTGIRSGRASTALLDSLRIYYHGSALPLKQVATLSIPEPRTIAIQPWDVSIIQDVEKAIFASALGLTPSNDGKIIRIGVPPLTEDRRKEFIKHIKKLGEDCKVAIRNVRREANDQIKASEKKEHVAEDSVRREQDEVQKLADQIIVHVDQIIAQKEHEIMEI